MFKKSFLFVMIVVCSLTFSGVALVADPNIHPMEGVPKMTVVQASVMTHAIQKEDGTLNFGITGFNLLVELSQPGDTVAKWNSTKDFNSAKAGKVQLREDGLYEFSFRPEVPATIIYFWFGACSNRTGYPNIKVVKIDHSGVSEAKL